MHPAGSRGSRYSLCSQVFPVQRGTLRLLDMMECELNPSILDHRLGRP